MCQEDTRGVRLLNEIMLVWFWNNQSVHVVVNVVLKSEVTSAETQG